MNNYMVSLDLTTTAMNLQELAAIIGINGDPGSHDVGSPRPGNREWRATVLSIGSLVPPNAPLDEHLESILRRNPIPRASGVLPADSRLTLNIGVIFNTADCSIRLPAKTLQAFGNQGINLNVHCYPGDENSGE